MRTTAIIATLVFLFAALTAGPARADQRIEKIRALYTSALELVCGNEDECGATVHRLRMATTLAAIGLQVTDVRFYHTSWQAAPEKDPYLMDHSLKMVAVTYNIAGGIHYRIEYLYDDKGNPVFYYWQEKNEYGQKPVISEKRYYWEGGRLIQAIVDMKPDEGPPQKYTRTAGFSAGDLADAKYMHAKAIRYRGLFRTILQAEQWK